MLISYFAAREKRKSAELPSCAFDMIGKSYFFLIVGFIRFRKTLGFLLKWKTANTLMISPVT